MIFCAAAVAAALASLVGCAGDEPTAPIQDPVVLEGPLITAVGDYAEESSRASQLVSDVQLDSWRACAASEGFEYPVAAVVESVEPLFLRVADWTEREVLATYGYGISTLEESDVSAASPEDGLLSYLRELPEQDRRVFSAAFFGESRLPFLGGLDLEADNVGVFLDPDSCYAAGVNAGQDYQDEHFAVLNDLSVLASAFDDVQGEYLSDRRTSDIYRSYADCMRNKGYELRRETPAAVVDLVFDQYNEYQTVHDPQGRGAAQTPAAREALELVQEFEKTAAVQSLDCESSHREELRGIYSEVETAWISRNPDIAALINARG